MLQTMYFNGAVTNNCVHYNVLCYPPYEDMHVCDNNYVYIDSSTLYSFPKPKYVCLSVESSYL